MRALKLPNLSGKLLATARTISKFARPPSIAVNASPKLAIRPITPSKPICSSFPRVQPASPTASPVASQTSCRTFASTSGSPQLSRTPLYDFHLEHGAKMVPFGGWEMPLHYSDLSHTESHHWTRNKASLFDVSHMVQHHLSGPGAESFLMRLTPSSISSLAFHHGSLSCLLDPSTGGIVDDTVIARLGPDTFYFVTNAGCRNNDLAYLETHLKNFRDEGGKDVQWTILPPALLALQGPSSASALLKLLSPANKDLNDLSTLHFGQSRLLELSVITPHVLVSRGGYTGEDGFEIAIPEPGPHPKSYYAEHPINTQIKLVASHLLQDSDVKLAGLAARDSLRLEAGMCLYGHDISLDTTPVAAGLSWIIGKDRRSGPLANFYGSDTILSQLKKAKDGGTPPPVRRVGLLIEKGPPAREGADIVDPTSGETVGKATSGVPSPSLGGANIAMALVKNGMHKKGTELAAVVRGKRRKATVVGMPFVDSKFYRG